MDYPQPTECWYEILVTIRLSEMIKADLAKNIAGLWFIIIGIGVILKGKVSLEGTNDDLTGTGAILTGVFLISFGIFLFFKDTFIDRSVK